MLADQGFTGLKIYRRGFKMAEITVQSITTAGLTPVAGVAAGATGDTVPNNGRTYIEIEDTGTTAPTVTVASQVDCDQGFTHDVSVAVPESGTKLIGPFPPNRFNNDDQQIEVTYSSETDVTIRAFTL
jgi:hypothetical protein